VTCFMSGDTGLAGFCQNLACFFFLVRADTETLVFFSQTFAGCCQVFSGKSRYLLESGCLFFVQLLYDEY
jgi:hypothetical protein